MFEFTGLRILYQDMRNIGETRAIFTFKYNEKMFSCIFLVDIVPYRLYLATLGTAPLVFELEIDGDYKTKSYLEDYKKLVKYLDLKYDPNHIFKPNDFFKVLNRNIPHKFTKKPNYREVIAVVVKRRNIEEENKIYFCGWHKNPKGKFVRVENIEKTRSAFGDEKAEICERRNISSCWTDIATGENLQTIDSVGLE